MQIHELVSLLAPDDSTNVLAIDTGSRTYKITYANLAKAIIESYADSSLYGDSQTIKQAFAAAQTATSTVTSDLTAAINACAQTFVSTSNTTQLDNIPVNSMGRVLLSNAQSPNGSSVVFSFFCFGNSSRRVLIVSRPESSDTWVNYYAGSWSGWTTELSGRTAKVTPTVFSPGTGSSWSTQGNCWYYKIGTRVHVHVAVEGIAANSNATLVTLPSGYVPYGVTIAGARGASASNHATVWVNSSGVVSARSTDTSVAGDLEFDAFG